MCAMRRLGAVGRVEADFEDPREIGPVRPVVREQDPDLRPDERHRPPPVHALERPDEHQAAI